MCVVNVVPPGDQGPGQHGGCSVSLVLLPASARTALASPAELLTTGTHIPHGPDRLHRRSRTQQRARFEISTGSQPNRCVFLCHRWPAPGTRAVGSQPSRSGRERRASPAAWLRRRCRRGAGPRPARRLLKITVPSGWVFARSMGVAGAPGWQEAGMASLRELQVAWVALGRWRTAVLRAVPPCRRSMRLSGCGCAGRVWSRCAGRGFRRCARICGGRRRSAGW